MPVRVASVADLDEIVDLLEQRRQPLVTYAPIFWRPAADARAKHRAFLKRLLTTGGAHAYRTDNAVLIAVPRGDGWLVDDAYVVDEKWMDGNEGPQLWSALAADCPGAPVRMVCPTYEHARSEFATCMGAPPVYAPPGPVLFLPAPRDARAAVPAAITKASEIGCSAVVVNQVAGDDALAEVLTDEGLRRHCDYFSGSIQALP